VAHTDYDVLVIGSGFGGSVAALRLTEKGYRVGVLEAGRRFADDEFGKTSWDLRRFLWAPQLGCFGIQRIHKLRDVLILAGAGVGGGSLVYANTLYEPMEPFFADKQWAHITDWRDELSPHYKQAERMLGVVTNPSHTPSDVVMQAVAEEMGVGETFHSTPVGVFFGTPGEKAADPYFGGVGPERTGCTECGSCMTGCRVGAKNTLVKNYLGLAETAGAEVLPLTTATGLEQRADGSWAVTTKRTGAWVRKRPRTITAGQVVLAAGTWGTQNLLFAMKDQGLLPRLSASLGELTRTNSESIVGAGAYKVDPTRDFTRGVAITSSFHPDGKTHIEPVRYGKGSNAMGLLQTLMTDGGGPVPRWVKFLAEVVRHHLHQEGGVGPQAVQQAGTRRAQPDLDSGRQRGDATDGEAHRRGGRRHLGRDLRHTADGALHRRMHHWSGRRSRRHRPLPPGLQLPGSQRGRRRGDLGEPWREPLADHHRAGRARLLAVAEQGGERLPARAVRPLLPGRPGGTATSGGARGGAW